MYETIFIPACIGIVLGVMVASTLDNAWYVILMVLCVFALRFLFGQIG